MRIAITAARLDPHHGGAGAWTIAFARWLHARGHDVHLAGFKVGRDVGLPPERVQCLEAPGTHRAAAQALSHWLAPRRFDIVHDMGVGCEFDVFHSHFGSLQAMESAKQRSRARLHRLVRRLSDSLCGRKRSIARLAAQQFSHPRAIYIAVSKMVAEDLTRFEGVDRTRIRCVPNGVDTQQLCPERRLALRESARRRFAIAGDDLAVSVIAHNFWLKGVPQLIETLRGLQAFPAKLHLLVVGGHRQRPQRHSLGQHVLSYTGALDSTEEIYAATDAYLHPTIYDACSLSVLEAMAYGLPTLTTRSNGAAERIVHMHNGLITRDAFDREGLEACLRMLIEPSVREALGARARAASLAWTQEDSYLAIERLYVERSAASLTEPRCRDVLSAA